MRLRHFFFIIFACSFFTACSQPAHKSTGTHQVIVLPPKEFQAKMQAEKGVLLDVRTPAEYKNGHLAGSRLLNIFSDDFEAEIAKLDTNGTYFVYCASGGRSSECATLMQKKGFRKVYDMDGGFGKWRAEGLPFE